MNEIINRKQTIVLIKSFICVAAITSLQVFLIKYRVKYNTKEQATIQHNSMTAKQHFANYEDKKHTGGNS